MNDIIEYNGTAWVKSFDASSYDLRAYVTNTFTGQQFKFENGEWSDTFQNIRCRLLETRTHTVRKFEK